MKCVVCFYASAVAVLASLGAVTQALTIDSSAVAPPEDVVGEHQTLQRTWTISSAEELEKLHLLIPGRVFVDLEENLPAVIVPVTVAPPQPTPASSTSKPVVVVVASTSGSGSSAEDDEIVFTSSASSASESEDSDADIVFPVPAVTVDAVAPATQAPKKVVSVVVVEEEDDDGSSSLEGSSESAVGAVNVGDVTMQLRGGRELKEHDSDDDSSDDKKHKKHHKPTEAVVAKIVVTGNSSALLELFEVIALHPSKENGLKIHLANKDANVEGFVLTQIILKNKNYIRHLSTELADDVVIGDGVFVEDDKDTAVKIATSGPGNVLIKSTAKVALGALTIDVAGSGVVQIDVPALKLEASLDANVAGSGTIALLADAYLKSVQTTTAVSGDGSLIVHTKNFKTEDFVAAVYGSGSTSFASAGNVTTEKLTLSGSGKLLAGSIVAEKSSVSVWGSGDVIVQATDKLKVSTSFSGSVGYVGERPEKVKTSKWLFWRSDIVHPAAENTVIAYEAVAAPARYPLYYSLVTKQVFYAEDPIVKLTTATTQSYLVAVSTHLSTVAHGPNGFLIFSMVATTLVVVGLAANSFQKRRIRRHYRPLVRTCSLRERESTAQLKAAPVLSRTAAHQAHTRVSFPGIVTFTRSCASILHQASPAMLRSTIAQAALLISAALLALSSQPLPVAAVITVTSNGPTPLASQLQPPMEPRDDDDSDSELDPPSHQSWERTWTVASHTALLDDRDEIVEVKVSIPGRVFLSTSAGQAPLAKLRFSGNSAEVLDFFEVVSTSSGVLEIRQRAGLTSNSLTGYLLVEVTLAHIQKLKSVTATGSADVIIENDVLVAYSTSDTVALVVQGSGSIFAHDTTSFNVQQFTLTVAGSGDIELSTAQIEAKALSATVGGSGNIRLFANSVRVKETALAVAGPGNVYLNSYNFNSGTVAVAVAGSGDVSVYPRGKCTSEQVVIAGSGNAYLGSIACVHANVKIGGAGDAIVQASQTLDGGVVGIGDVKYVGQAPATIAPEASLFSSKKNPKPMAKAASYNKYDEAKIHDLPERTPVHLSINFASDNFTDRSLLVPLVLLALLSLWFIRHENNKQNAHEQRALRAQELQPLAGAQSQAQVYV